MILLILMKLMKLEGAISMKKTFLTLSVSAVLLLSACNDKDNVKIEPKAATQTQVATEQKTEFPALNVKTVDIFNKGETIEIPSNKGEKEQASLFTYVNLAETQVAWLNQLLLNTQYKQGINYLKHLNQINETQESQPEVLPTILSKANLTQLFTLIHQRSLEVAKKNGNRGMEFAVQTTYLGQKNNWVGFHNTIYSYEGGAHGIEISEYLNIDVDKQSLVTLDQLIDKKDQPAILNALWKVYDDLSKEANFNTNYIEKTDFYISPDFYFDQDGVNFVYQPYALFPYAFGEITLTLPWEQQEAELIKFE
ncbi:hypothetical protein DM482_00035 [Avibacterium paragallinarum]|nr:hypothetical protein DM482_00035 [Avibacterium paragallinarum]PXZ41771.1 hypothetical protein DM481_03750 [Avibacterium paragallinarum]